MGEIKGEYSASEQGNFKVIDTIGVPHPYCITPKHIAYASDHCGGMLGKSAIIGAEESGAECDICRHAWKAGKQPKVLTYAEHEQALLVECKIDIQPPPDELHKWLLSLKGEAERNGYAGFAFKRA